MRKPVLLPRLTRRSLQDVIQNLLAAQKENSVLWLPVLLGLGIGLYMGAQNEPVWWSGLIVLCLLCAASLAARAIWRKPVLSYILSGLCIIALGWCAAQWRVYWVEAPILPKSMTYAQIEGVIHTLDDLEGAKGVRLVLTDNTIEKIAAENTPHFIRLSVRKHEGLIPGQRISVLAGLNPPAAPTMPGGYDFQRHAYFKKIGAYGFAYGAPEILEQTSIGWLERFRQNGARYVESIIPQPEASIVSALLLGERASIPEDTWEDIRAAGLAHVISISGLHISMIAVGVFFITRLIMALIPALALHHPIKKYAALLGLISCVAYGVMVGLDEVPTLRSVIMTTLVLCAVMIDRNPFSLRVVGLAAFFILLTQPESLMNPGFQMSFAAVAALIFFYEETRIYWKNMRQNAKNNWAMRFGIWLWAACLTSVVATLASTPFTLYHFQQFPLYSVIGNILALPVIGFLIMPAAVIAYILMPLGVEAPAIWLMGKGVSIMLWISAEIASWSYAAMDLVTWPLGALLSFVLAGLWIMIFKGSMVRSAAFLPLAAGIVSIIHYQPPDILVASNTKLMMIQPAPRHAFLSSLRSEKFTAQSWLKNGGIAEDNVDIWPQNGILHYPPSAPPQPRAKQYASDRIDSKHPIPHSDSSPNAILSCDIWGCHADLKGKKIAFSFHALSRAEDCARTDIIISTQPVSKSDRAACKNASTGKTITIIDRWDLRNNGAHAIWIKNDDFTIQAVSDQRGSRPWTKSGAHR